MGIVANLPSVDALFVLEFEGHTVVSISADGTISYGTAYHPSVAAKHFWEAVAAVRPKVVAA